ncbi:MAG: hypothetical protein FJX31_11880 [Alphaproteobacteria bacterium]|nr:hypothetical protein [Alphaproteobacteria bacterium]
MVVGSNPEMADMSNPRGEIHGEAFYVVAEAANGRRWQHQHSFITASMNGDGGCAARAEKLRVRIADAYAAGRRLDTQHWVEIDPAYGSDAYVEQDVDAHRWAREREEEFA